MSDPTTNTLHPPTDATLTVRVIKSFTYRTERSAVLHHLDLTTMTVAELKTTVINGLCSSLMICVRACE